LEDMSRNYNSDGFLEYKFTMGKIMQVFFLYGFDGTKNPIWRKMTRRRYATLSGKRVVCKLEPYRNESVGYKQTTGLDLNVYNKCFLLEVQREVVTTGPAEASTTSTEALTAQDQTPTTIDIPSIPPSQIADLDFDIVTDEDILKMNDLQLDKVPHGRKKRLVKSSTKVSRNGIMCNLLADEKENEEFKNANPRTGFVSTSRTRDTNTTTGNQQGDVY
jgi:hypothetical protein